MRNKKTGKTAVCLGCILMMMCAVTGCAEGSESTQGQEEEIIRIEDSMDVGGQQETNEEAGGENVSAQTADEDREVQAESETASEDKNNHTPDNTQDETELTGDVISIGEGSMVVNQVFTYEQDGADIAVSDMSENAVSINVYFSENTEFIVRTVKNGGVNGDADIENEAGTSDDLQERSTVLMTGGYEGEDFHAKQVIIYHFV